MSERWFYRMFGEEFGPVPLEKLKELNECGTLSATDEVRAEGSSNWVVAASIEQLGLGEATSTLEDADISDFDLETTSKSTNDDWYCLMGGTEFGPWSFDELSRYAESEQLSADDEVKLGANGKWRRVGSIGRLMALLPYKPVEKNIVRTPPKPVVEEIDEEFELPPISNEVQPVAKRPSSATIPVYTQPTLASGSSPVIDTQAALKLAFEQAKAKIVESMMAKAESEFKTAEEQAKQHVAWASAPNVDKYWFGWASGVEFGPVEFSQVFGLAKSGQLKPTDFVRNGQFAQFGPASNVPGLYTAVALIAKATETLNLAKTQAQAAASLAAPPPVIDTTELLKASASSAAIPVPTPAAVAPATSSPGRSGSSISTINAPAPRSSASMPRPDADPYESVLNSDSEVRRAPEPMPPAEPRTPAYGGSPYSSSSSLSGSYSSSSMASMSSMSSSSMSTYGGRPAAIPPKPVPRKSRSSSDSRWLADLMENLKEPKAIGSIAVIALVGLLVGWQFMPKSRAADIKKYQAMKVILDDIRANRTDAGKVSALQQKLERLSKEMTSELKKLASRDEPAKQCLLWAARDEVPRAVRAGFATESEAEKALMGRLMEAAYELRLEKRPPVDPALQLARSQSDD